MKNEIRIGYIGLGRRGTGMLKHCFSKMSDVKVEAVCDLSETRMKNAVEIVMQNAHYEPRMVTDYHDILADKNIDAVVIMIGWAGRPAMAMESMRAGKYTAIEVGCTDMLEDHHS